MLDSEGNLMVLGAKYEMFVPIAKLAEQSIGIKFKDSEGYTFTYQGTASLGDHDYLVTEDVSYTRDSVPTDLTPECTALFTKEGGVHPLCPVYVAKSFVRPVTNE